jgi:hypothetical protein
MQISSLCEAADSAVREITNLPFQPSKMTGCFLIIGNPIHFGGLGAYVHLKPGQSVEIPVDLTKWFRFEKPGRIMLRGSYYMGFSDPSQAGYSFIWEDFACAEFSIQIKENG